ncbi:MAG: hypothetical protein IPM79_34680 [Polyangiaceae bacterium]|nr:hypothetical protein [Polyangiaceae bacterium]
MTFLVSFTLGCSAGGGTGGSGAGTGASSQVGGGGGGVGQGGDSCQFGCAGGTGDGGGSTGFLSISPSNPVIDVVNGASTPVTFTVTQSGQDVTSQVSWFFERPDIGLVNNTNGVFTATNQVAGVGNLRVALGNAEANTSVTVNITQTINNGGVPNDVISALDNPSGGADSAMQILYPYDQTVFPLGVLAPEIMWNGGAGGDYYKLSIQESHYSYVEYFTTAPPARKLITEQDWANISASGLGAESDPVAVSLTRYSGGTAYQPITRTWKIAQGKLKGAVYYWELPDACGAGNGRVLRIKPDVAAVDEFYQPGQCWGCHTVSRDGTRMMATLESGSPFPQVTIDLTQEPAQPSTIGPGTLGGTFSAYNNDGSKILVSNDGDWGNTVNLRVVDAVTGVVLNNDAMGANCGEPAWSPDGLKMAAICGVTNSWIFDSYSGYMVTADVAADGITTSNLQTIVPQGSPGRPAYPSFAPGNEYIAYGRPTQGSRSTGDGKLYLVKTDGTDAKVLENASNDNRSFNPVFAPLRAGGYSWLVFISRRNYGNRLVGANRQQLWITAITDPPTAVDPSHPPFYMRGQEDCGKSENAYFALEPCKEVGESCESGVDCCNGQCVQDQDTGMLVCGDPPPPGECSELGNACETAADCCDAEAICLDNFCQLPPPR